MIWLPRFHLSTALTMMLAASLVVSPNVRFKVADTPWESLDPYVEQELRFYELECIVKSLDHPGPPITGTVTFEQVQFGWPVIYKKGIRSRNTGCYKQFEPLEKFQMNRTSLVVNVLVCLTLVIAAGVICEFFVRRNAPKIPLENLQSPAAPV